MKTIIKSNRLSFLLRVSAIYFVMFFVLCIANLHAQTILHDISTGDLIIPGNSVNDYIITGYTTTYKVEVQTGYEGTITLRNATIHSLAPTTNTNTYSPFTIYGQYDCSNYSPVTIVNLILEGTNDLYYTGGGYACLQVDQGAQINISAIDPNDNSSGILFAKANAYVPGVNYSVGGAGIGAPNANGTPQVTYVQGTSPLTGTECNGATSGNTAGGNIIISSGTVTAWGGHGAGIGGGFQNYYNGVILIYGGIVEARGGFDAAGIGSGCPRGTGVIGCYADKSAVFALPPAQIEAYGAGATAIGGVGMNQFAELGLTGTKYITYINDPNKTLITVHTQDTLPNADIYLDLTQIPNLVQIFTDLNINYDLTKVRVGRTDAITGMLEFRGEFQQTTTFFTDASSINPATYGRPYMPKDTIITGNAANRATVILPLLPTDISFTDFPSIPLEVGYTTTEALDHAFRTKVSYNDATPMTSVTYVLQDGIDFSSLIFLAADSFTVISPPSTLTSGDVFYIIFPIDDGKPLGVYSDVLLIDGVYGSTPLPGYIRKIGMQRVIFDDSYDNDYIRVTADTSRFTTMYPTTNTVTLTLNIDHTGTGVLYDYLDVVAMYLVTPIADYSLALAANPLYSSGWQTMNVPLLNNGFANTTVDFSTMPAGTYYIHWYVESGVVYAHSLDVTDPPRLYGGFGPYTLMNIKANDDFVQVVKNGFEMIPVKDNDILISSCASIIPTVTTPPVNGTASIQSDSILYTPTLDYIGYDSMIYRLVCSGDTSYAKVRIRVIEAPDNITDETCYVVPRPTGAWSIKNRYSSNTVDGGDVFEMSVPLVGDIDNDGNIEIVCAGRSLTTGTFICDSIKVFNGLTGTIKYKFPVERFHAGFGSIAMADVEGDGYAEIFVATHADAAAGNRGYIYCYSHNGSFKWKSNVPYTLDSVSLAFPYMKVIDFNGDGIPEIMANDRIFNAVTGDLLLDCQLISKGWDYGTGAGHNSYLPAAPAGTSYFGNFSSTADMDGDGLPELVAGRNIYKISLNDLTNPSLNTCTILRSAIPGGHNELGDGYTSVADLDLDGTPDVIVIRINPAARTTKYLYAWSGKTGQMLHTNTVSVSDSNGSYGGSIPFIGDLDGDGVPEISFTVARNLHAFRYNKSASTLMPMSWSPLVTTDGSGATTLTLFDFDQDDKMELVYRDEQNLRIIDGTTGTVKLGATIPCFSWTMNEYPVIADVTGGGYANIVVLGKPASASHGNGYLYVFEHNLSIPGAVTWAPTRKVWNQWAYNAVNINEDLTVPRYQMNPATVFAGLDGIFGTSDDIRPYNGFLVQQTLIDDRGIPVWLTPDVTPVPSTSSIQQVDDSILFNLTVSNIGAAAIGPPIHYTIYKESIPSGYIMNDSVQAQLNAPGTTTFTFKVAIADCQPAYKLIVRINDKNGQFPFQPECDDTNNVIEFINPALYQLMRKDAILLPSFAHNGTFANPVSVLFSEYIEYTITAVNANINNNTTVVIRDTLPAYLDYYSSNPSVIPVTVGQRTALEWIIPSLASMATTSVKVVTTPQLGAVASQPMFDNRAWVQAGDTILPTNYTWHQGAGFSLVTFSAGFGGKIYHATEQALDYRTSPRSGIVVVPDEGYLFAGWSHADYVSLRGETIRAQSGVMRYDTLTVYGNVDLHAEFELEVYPITYHLHGGQFPDPPNSPFPTSYTIESGAITLGAPEKAGDVFTGWTGSNGDEPQQTVTIAAGSTGEQTYYANYLQSGRIRDFQPEDNPDEDRIWAAGNELYVRTTTPGSILRIYSPDGVLLKQQIILQPGESKYRLSSGIFVATLNNGVGKTVIVE